MQGYISTLMTVLTRPRYFFDNLSLAEGYDKPIKFVIFSIALSTIIEFVVTAIFGQIGNIFSSLVILVRNLIGGILGLFILYGIIHVFLRVLGAKKGFEATFRVGAYMTSFLIFAWIPYFGIIILLYTLYLEVGIFAKIHEISTARSFIGVMFIPLALLSLFAISKFSYLYMSSIQKEVMSTTREGLINLTLNNERNFSKAEVDSVFNKDGKMNIVLRNTGRSLISAKDIMINVLIGKIIFSGCDVLTPNDICTLEVTGFYYPDNSVRMTNVSFPSNASYPVKIDLSITTPNQSTKTTYQTYYLCKIVGNECVRVCTHPGSGPCVSNN